MDKQHFDSKECSILFEALDAWEKGDSSGLVMGSILGCMVAGDDPASREIAKRKSEEKVKEFEREVKTRKETSLRLKVKIMDMRDAHIVDLKDITKIKDI